MKTAMQNLIEYTKEMKDKNMFNFSNFFEEAEQLMVLEKQQIIDSVNYGKKYHKDFDFKGNEYYSETFNNND